MQNMNILIFTGGLFPFPQQTQKYFSSTHFDFVIAADSGLEACRLYGLSPNLILGDFDSLKDKKLLSLYPKEIIKKFDCDKDFTDTQLSLMAAHKLAKEKNANPFITLVGGDGGRISHLLSIYNSFSTKFRPDVWLLKEEALYFLQKGQSIFISDLKESDSLSICRTSDFFTGGKIKAQGLEWPDSHFNKKAMPSLSNRISKEALSKKEKVFLKACRKNFLVILPHTAFVEWQM